MAIIPNLFDEESKVKPATGNMVIPDLFAEEAAPEIKPPGADLLEGQRTAGIEADKQKKAQEQAAAAQKQAEINDPANWSAEQTKEHYRKNPPKNAREAVEAKIAIKAKEEQENAIVQKAMDKISGKPKSSVIPNLFAEEPPKSEAKSSLLQEAIVKPVKTLYGGVLKASANTADTLDFYADKISKTLNIPETKNSIFEYLRDNWNTVGTRLQKEGLSKGVAQKIYSGLGEAGWEVPKLMALGPEGLVISGAAEGGKTGGVKGAVVGATTGALFKGTLKGMGTLPSKVKYPVAFGVGAATTPGGLEEKVAGGTVLAGLSAGKSPSMEEFKAAQKESPLVKGYQKVLPFEARERIYQNYVNRFQSIENTVQKAKDLGADILPGENPTLRARGYLGIGQKVKTVLENNTYKITPEGKIEITGEGLKPILDSYDQQSPIKGREVREKDLNDYLIARRTIEDLQRPKSEFTTENIATPEQVKTAQDTLDNLNQKYGSNISHLDQTATRLYDYQKRVLNLLVDSGNMSQEQYDTILTKNPNYVPFDRVIENADTSGTPVSKNRFTGARSPIKRIKGSELEIHNPIESMIKNTYRIMDIAERNTVAKGVADLSKVLPEDISPVKVKMQPINIGKFTEGEPNVIFRPSQFKPKGNVIEYFENGKRGYIEVSDNLYQAMSGLNETSSGLLTKIMSKPAQWLRTGATITPEFMVRNPIRDQWTAFMQTKLGFKPFIDTTGAIADIMGKSEAYNDWLRSGGAYSGFVETSRGKLKGILKDLQGKPNLLKNLNIITKAGDISQLFEQATRLGVYKAGIKKGLTPVEAGFESREATVDFARRGAKTKDMNAVIAFFNAGIQGSDKSIRTAMADPAGFAVKGIASITIPSVISYLLNKDDEGYKELPKWEKDLFWIFKVKDTYVRIHKPFLYGQVFGSMPERFLEYLNTEDPKALEGFGKSLYDAMSPVSGDPASGLLATGVKPIIENATNWNFFRQAPIVPEGKQRLMPSEQYGRYTSETAKAAGEILNYSPAKIENLIQGWFGGSGRYALETGDIGVKAIDKLTGNLIMPERPMELADVPLVKGFITRPPLGSQSESVKKFYDSSRSITQFYLTVIKRYKEGDNKGAEKLQKKYPEFISYSAVNKTSQMLSDLSDYSDMIIKSDKPAEEKRKLLKEVDMQKTEIAKQANKMIGDIKKPQPSQKKSSVVPNLFD